MAIELCSSDDSSLGIMSPARISFSHDVSQTGSVPVEQYIRSTSPSSSIDFDFCVFRESFDLESSSADELFFDGKILPIEIKRRISSAPPKKTEQSLPPPPHPLPPSNTTLHCGKTSNNEYAIQNPTDEKQNPNSNSNSKSFWRFKRSSSCGSGYARTLCPLPLLSRSNSTGSSPSVKQQRNSTLSKDNNNNNNIKHHSQRHFSKSMSSNGSSNSQKPPLKKATYNNGVKFSPVLNVPPANLFGLSTFFSSGKEKNNKKK